MRSPTHETPLVPLHARQHACHAASPAPRPLLRRTAYTFALPNDSVRQTLIPASASLQTSPASDQCNMSCGYGTVGFQCDEVYTLGGKVTPERAQEIFSLGKSLGFTDFNPTMVDWDNPIT